MSETALQLGPLARPPLELATNLQAEEPLQREGKATGPRVCLCVGAMPLLQIARPQQVCGQLLSLMGGQSYRIKSRQCLYYAGTSKLKANQADVARGYHCFLLKTIPE